MIFFTSNLNLTPFEEPHEVPDKKVFGNSIFSADADTDAGTNRMVENLERLNNRKLHDGITGGIGNELFNNILA